MKRQYSLSWHRRSFLCWKIGTYKRIMEPIWEWENEKFKELLVAMCAGADLKNLDFVKHVDLNNGRVILNYPGRIRFLDICFLFFYFL